MGRAKKLEGLDEIRAMLRKSLAAAEECDEPLIWAQIGQAFGHLCNRIRLYEQAGWRSDSGQDDAIPTGADPDGHSRDIYVLEEMLIVSVTLADSIGANEVSRLLDDALISLSGKGIMSVSRAIRERERIVAHWWRRPGQ